MHFQITTNFWVNPSSLHTPPSNDQASSLHHSSNNSVRATDGDEFNQHFLSQSPSTLLITEGPVGDGSGDDPIVTPSVNTSGISVERYVGHCAAHHAASAVFAAPDKLPFVFKLPSFAHLQPVYDHISTTEGTSDSGAPHSPSSNHPSIDNHSSIYSPCYLPTIPLNAFVRGSPAGDAPCTEAR